jgi:DNA-binding response OmpR family regulator
MTKGNTIVVLDDDPDIGTMIRVMLEFRGYEVIVIQRARDLFELLQNRTVNLVITDLLLSGDNGTEVCSQLKEDPATSDIPVIMFSAHPNARDICLKAGADEFMAKPFDMKELYSKVDELVLRVNR